MAKAVPKMAIFLSAFPVMLNAEKTTCLYRSTKALFIALL
jgi:hypothetical protein